MALLKKLLILFVSASLGSAAPYVESIKHTTAFVERDNFTPRPGVHHPILKPHVPAHVDTGSLDRLNPGHSHQLWYAQKAVRDFPGRRHAAVQYEWTHPTVFLDHYRYISVKCDTDSMQIEFVSNKAFQHAEAQWSRLGGEVNFVSAETACSIHHREGDRTYFIGSDMSFNKQDQIVQITGRSVSARQVAKSAKLEFGEYLEKYMFPETTKEKRDIPTKTNKKPRTSPSSCVAVNPKRYVCGKHGTVSKGLVWKTVQEQTMDKCRDACFVSRQCRSFSIDGSTCTLYRSTVLGASFTEDSSSSAVFYNRHCFKCSSDAEPTATSTTTPPETTITTSTTSDKTDTTTTPTTVPKSPCEVPADTINGCPAVNYCDDDFDSRLDSVLGFGDPSDASFLKKIAPGLSDDQIETSRLKLAKRDFWDFLEDVGDFFEDVANTIANVATSIATDVANFVVAAANFVWDTAKLVWGLLTGRPSVEFSLPAYFMLPQPDASPWGYATLVGKLQPANPDSGAVLRAKQLHGEEGIKAGVFGNGPGIALYCQNCGVDINFYFSGIVEIDMFGGGITGGHLKTGGSYYVGLYAGLDAMYPKTFSLGKKTLVYKEFGGFKIPFLCFIGPEFSVETEVAVEIKAQGQLMMGFDMSMDDSEVYIDLGNVRKSYSYGWEPENNHAFNVAGEISSALVWELPIGLGFGIDLLSGTLRKEIALVSTPSLSLDAKVEASWSIEQKTLPDGTVVTESTPGEDVFNEGECPGVALGVNIGENLDLNILDITAIRVYSTEAPVATACHTLWYKPGETPTTTATSTATTTRQHPTGTAGCIPKAMSNPSFSSDIDGWTAQADKNTGTSNTIYDVDQSGGVQDVYALYTYCRSGKNTAEQIKFFRYFNVCPGTYYEPSFSYFISKGWANNNNSFASLPLLIFDVSDISTGAAMSSSRIRVGQPIDGDGNKPGVWNTVYPTKVKIPEGVTQVSVLFALLCDSSSLGNEMAMWWDDVSMTPYCVADTGLTNPSFENGMTAWPVKKTGDFNKGAVAEAYPDNEDGGQHSLYNRCKASPGAVDSEVTVSNTINTCAGTVYDVSFIYWQTKKNYLNATRPVSEQPWFQVGIGNDVLDDSIVTSHTTSLGKDPDYDGRPAGAWNKVSLGPVAAPATGGPVTIWFRLHCGPGTEMAVWYDNVTFVQTSPNKVRRDLPALITAAPDKVRRAPAAAPDDDPDSSPTSTDDSNATPTGTLVTGDDGESFYVDGMYDTFSPATDADFASPVTPDIEEGQQYNFPSTDPVIVDNPAPDPKNPVNKLQYTHIVDTTQTFQLHSGDDSNFYTGAVDPADVSGLYAGTRGVYGADSGMNLFIYYADEMENFGVSRFRVVGPDKLPNTARLAALSPVEDGQGGHIYILSDTLGNYFYTVGCNFADTDKTKLFIVKDITKGLRDLQTNTDLVYTVLGGNPTNCGGVAFKADGPVTSSS